MQKSDSEILSRTLPTEQRKQRRFLPKLRLEQSKLLSVYLLQGSRQLRISRITAISSREVP